MMYTISLIVHALAGGTALIAGIPAMTSKKGSKLHTLSGLIYFYSMLVVCGSAFFITLFVKENSFLLAIGLFTLYMVIVGRSFIQYFRNTESRSIKYTDLIPHILGMLIAAYMILSPLVKMIQAKVIIIPVLSIFGIILFSLALGNLLMLRKMESISPRDKRFLIKHISAMGGAYIATFTAFAVVNINLHEYNWITWLLPTIIGTIFISRATITWTKKLRLNQA